MRARLLLAALATLVPAAAGLAPTGAADTPKCQRWNIEVSCSVSRPAVVIGEDFTATVVAKNTGDSTLSNVTLRVRADQGAPCAAGAGASTSILVDKFEPGETKTLTARFVTEGIGTARLLGSARDSLGWASGNCACTVDIYGLPAVQTQMADKDVAGAEKGIFRVGEEFLYVLGIENDGGTSATPDIEVVLNLPRELEFVSGGGDSGIKVSGSGQTAKTSRFVLGSPNQKAQITFRVKVLAVPPSQFVKARATVQTTGGVMLASDTESTTVR